MGPFSVATMLAGALKIKSSNFMTGTALGFLPWGFGLNELGQGFASILQMEQITILESYKNANIFPILNNNNWSDSGRKIY